MSRGGLDRQVQVSLYWGQLCSAEVARYDETTCENVLENVQSWTCENCARNAVQDNEC